MTLSLSLSLTQGGCMILSIYLPHIIEAILVTPNSNLKITVGIYAKKWFYVMISLVLIS